VVKKIVEQPKNIDNAVIDNGIQAEKLQAEKPYVAVKDIFFLGGKIIKAGQVLPKIERHVIDELIFKGMVAIK